MTIVAMVSFTLALRSDLEPATFGFNRAEFARVWNSAAADVGADSLVVGETTWTDRESGVFGFAFSDSMSVLARVESSELSDVQELAVVGQPQFDGLAAVLDAMNVVIRVAEPQLDEAGRRQVLTDLGVLGADPLDPGRRMTVGTTNFRVAVDAFGGVLGIGATPTGGSP